MKKMVWPLVIVLIFFAKFCSADDATTQPNILFIFSDDHAYQAISAYDSKINTTPHIDRIANEGMRFDRCQVTNSICGPSRAVILTGKYSHLNGFRQNGNKFDGSQQTFPKLLRKAGYQTAIYGKWHLASDPTGFDDWLVLPGQGNYYNPDFISEGGRRKIEGYTTDIITDKALEWLKNKRDTDKPFMLMLQHKAPHREWAPGPAHLNTFRGQEIPEPETLFDDYQSRSAVLAEQTMTIANHMRMGWDLKVWKESDIGTRPHNRFFNRMTDAQRKAWQDAYREDNDKFLAANLEGDDLVRWKYQRYIKDYLRCIQSVDDNIGRILSYLDDNQLVENTVVIYSSDQGFYLGEHGWYDKRWIFDESLRTPLVVRWPGVINAGSTSKQMVSNLDFAETFLEIAGVDVPDDMQGRSLVPLLKGQTPDDWRDEFYYHYYELGTHNVAAHYGIVTDQYKLVRYYKRLDENRKPQAIDQWDLMDRQADPLEMRSFYDDPKYTEIRNSLATQLDSLRRKLHVPDEE